MQPQESWVEKQIREATERGDFDDLPGAGRPLPHVDTTDPDWWIRRKMEREGVDASDALPPALQLRRERAGYPEVLVGMSREDDVREVLRDYNARVIDERRRPTFGTASPPLAPTLDVEQVVEEWRELRAARAAEAAQDAAAAGAGPTPSPAVRQGRWWWPRRRR